MKRKHLLLLGSLAIAGLGCVALGLRLTNSPPATFQANPLLVSAAISLKETLDELKPLYQRQGGVTVTYNFGASGALQKQIENGAPVDVFVSAGKQQMDALESQGLLATGSRRNLATNRLVLIVPQQPTTGLTSLRSLTDANVTRIAIGEPRSVPAGHYAEQVFRKLNLWNQLQPKLVLGNNVRQVLATVESGNADAGLVYLTDAKTSQKVKVVATASETDHSPIVYPMAVLKTSKNNAAAQAFVRFLGTPPAKAVLRKRGFTVAQ